MIYEIAFKVIEELAVFSVRTHKVNIDVIGELNTCELINIVDILFYVIKHLSAVNDLHIVIRPFDAAVNQFISSASGHRRGSIVKHSLAVHPHFREITDSRSHPIAEQDFAILYFDNSALAQFADRSVSLLGDPFIAGSRGQVSFPLALTKILCSRLLDITRNLLGSPEYSVIPHVHDRLFRCTKYVFQI